MAVIRKIITIALVIAAFAGAYYLGQRKKAKRLQVFAQCLTAKQARMYGLFWCPHCEDQKQMFGPSFQYVSYIECGVKGSHEETESCTQAGIKHFPTWEFADGKRQEGALPVQVLSEKTGCVLP
jgi:hypothetical protein